MFNKKLFNDVKENSDLNNHRLLQKYWSFLPQILAAIAGIVGIIAMIGWVYSIHILKSILPYAIEMKANTAIGIVLASIALIFHRIKNKINQFFIFLFSGVVLFIGIANFSQYLFGWNLKIDELLFRDTNSTFTSSPGRLAFLTSVSFILIGISLLTLNKENLKIQTRLLTIPTITIGLTVLLGYIMYANELITNHWSTPVAINTAFSITLLGVGILFSTFNNINYTLTNIEKRILFGLFSAFFLLILGAWLTYRKSKEYADSVKWVIHTQQVIKDLNQLYITLLDAESTQRSYLLTKIISHKDDYQIAINELNHYKKIILDQTSDNPQQTINMKILNSLIEKRIQKLNIHVTIFEDISEKDAFNAIATDDGLQIMSQIHLQIQNMCKIEESLLGERASTLSKNQEYTFLSILGSLIISVVILVAFYTGIRKEMEARTKAEALIWQEKEKAEKANKAKDSFLAIMSHEIRTPLTGMLGMLELLSMSPMEKEQSQTLDAAWDSGRGLLRIVSDILDWSKIEEGKLELCPKPTSISQLLKDVVNTYSKVASSKSLILWQHSDSRLSNTHIVDSLRLSQVLNNFVSNAIKFTKKGEIEVRAELKEVKNGSERVRFSVKDTGIGISKDVQEKLFQNYLQESAETARMYGGTGLGLAICRRLSEIMEGEINMESELNIGSTFSITLTLPITDMPAESIARSKLEVAQRSIKPIFENDVNSPLILAVDDHPTNRDLLARQLKLLGLRVETAENGNIALHKWHEKRFSLIISDCHMPEMDGYAFAQTIRKIETEFNLARTPIIGWTANALPEEEKNCIDAGMDDLLIKPTDMGQLKNKISRWLNLIPQEILDKKNMQVSIEKKTNVCPIDYSVLNKMVHDYAKQNQIILYFYSHIQNDANLLLNVLEKGDLKSTEDTAHKMKGSCLMVGAKALGTILEKIENLSQGKKIKEAQEEVANLKKAIKEIELYCSTLGHYDGKGIEG